MTRNIFVRLLRNPLLPLAKLWESNPSLIKSDELYLKTIFYLRMGERLDLKNPKNFNQKLQWLKLYDRNPIYTRMVDKYAVRDMVKNDLKTIPLLGVWDDVEDIDIDALPDKFVLKPNHDSGSIVICKDKKNFDWNNAKKKLKKALCKNYFLKGREWPYKNVPRKIVAEEYMECIDSGELMDYKFMCFNGKVEYIFVCHNRFKEGGLYVDFYNNKWERVSISRGEGTYSNVKLPRPKNFDRMIDLAEKYSKQIPFLRMDFYEIEGELFFGEFTFFPGGGIEAFEPKEADRMLGDLIELPQKTL